MKKQTLLILSGVLILILASTPDLAAVPAPAPASTPVPSQAPVPPAAPAPVRSSSDPDPTMNRVLADFMKTGVKVYFMGTQLGLNGWFLIKGNEVQIAYTTPDNQNLVVGVLFNAQGDNVSSQQVKTLYDSNKEFSVLLANVNAQQSVPGMGGASTPGVMPSIGNSSIVPPASPGERLIQALQGAAGVNVGASMAPKLFMVVDPNCPHCQATWRALRNAVFGGKLQVRLVPIGPVTPDSERAAAQFLHSADPLNSWDKYITGDQSQLAGTPDASSLAEVRGNRALIESWHIQTTPYMVYRSKDGQVKIVQGEPDQAAAIIDDIAP